MWALVGEFNEIYQERIGEAFEDHRYEKIVALFSSKEKAEKYIEKNTLKQPTRGPYVGYRPFRKKSLLANCEGAYVVAYKAPDYPIDPE